MKRNLKLFFLSAFLVATLIQVQTIPSIQKSRILMLFSESTDLSISRKIEDEWTEPRKVTFSEQEALISSFNACMTWTFWWEPFLVDSEVDLKIILHGTNDNFESIYFGLSSNKIVMKDFAPCEIPRRVWWVLNRLGP